MGGGGGGRWKAEDAEREVSYYLEYTAEIGSEKVNSREKVLNNSVIVIIRDEDRKAAKP